MGDGFLTPFNRVPGIMAQTLVAFGKLRAKVAQERVHGNAVGKGNTQPIRVFLKPRGEGGSLAVGKVRADLLVRLEPFVRLGTHRR